MLDTTPNPSQSWSSPAMDRCALYRPRQRDREKPTSTANAYNLSNSAESSRMAGSREQRLWGWDGHSQVSELQNISQPSTPMVSHSSKHGFCRPLRHYGSTLVPSSMGRARSCTLSRSTGHVWHTLFFVGIV